MPHRLKEEAIVSLQGAGLTITEDRITGTPINWSYELEVKLSYLVYEHGYMNLTADSWSHEVE